MAKLPEVTDATFEEEVLKAAGPVLVDFGAAWCAPCKQLDPVVEQLAEEWRGKVRVYHLDIDENMQTTMAYGVMGVPTLILFVDGEPRERLTGFQPKRKIVEKLGPYLPA